MASATIAELLVKVGMKVEGAKAAETSVAGVKKEAGQLGTTAGKAGGKLGKMGGALKTMAKGAAIAAAAVAAIGIAVFKFVDSQTQAIDATNKLATALGVNIEQLQRLQFAAGQSGVSANGLKAAILKLNEAMFKLTEGTGGKAAKALDSLGLSLKDLEGLTTTSQIGLIGERLSAIEDVALRSGLAAEIFGKKAGPEMASLLAEGQAGLEKLAASTENVLTQEQADRASAFQDAMGRMDQFMSGLAQTIAVELAPPITAIIDGVREWVAANREIIDSGVDVFMSILTELWDGLVRTINFVIAVFGPLVKIIFRLVKAIEDATGAFSAYKTVILALFTPIATITKLIVKLLRGLEKVRIVSKGTADSFEESMTRMSTSSNALDEVASKASNAEASLRRLTAAQQEFNATDPEFDLLSPENQKFERARRQADLAREAAENVRNFGKTKGGGGGKPKKPKDGKVKPQATPGKTVQQLRAALFKGDLSGIDEQIKGLADATPNVADVEPQVAIDFQNFDIDIEINGANMTNADVGIATATAIRAEFSKRVNKAAQKMKTKKKR